MRNLIYIPTIHEANEMHDPEFFNKIMTPVSKRQHQALWDNIFSGISNLEPDFRGMKMYVEACTFEIQPPDTFIPFFESISSIAAENKSMQQALTSALSKAGARQMPTEDQELHESVTKISKTHLNIFRGLGSGEINPEAARRLLAILGIKINEYNLLRDRAIAKNIDSTLMDGQTGLLILGIGHNVKQFLPDDCNFIFLTSGLEARWELFQYHQRKENDKRIQFTEGSRREAERI